MHGIGRNAEKDIYILFLFFISFLKIPYLKIVENFVLLCRTYIFSIYYINNQVFIHCTIFAQNRTIRTKVHKIEFCTENNNIVLKSTAFRTKLISLYSTDITIIQRKNAQLHKKKVRIRKGVFELDTFFIAKEVLFSSFFVY